jgi:hypothetical protein
MTKECNAREILAIVADWLGWQDETLSDGLKSPYDAVKLWEYAQAHPDLHEMADEWPRRILRDAIGYNPFKTIDDMHKATLRVEYHEFKHIKAI